MNCHLTRIASGLVAGIALCASAAEIDIPSLRARTDARIASIRATASLGIPPGCDVYYLAADGDDEQDGRTPATAWRTVERLNRQTGIRPGSCVLFRRGDLWRVSLDLPNHPEDRPFVGYAGGLQGRAGVTYSAYGEGPKPVLTTSPFNGAGSGRWQMTEVPGVWACPLGRTDVGNVVFDGGAEHGIKILPVYHKDGRTTAQYTGRPFRSYRDLDGDLHFYHDYSTNGIGRGTGMLYLRSRENPGARFKSIEFGVRHNIVTAHGQPDMVVDNLCLKYGGAHAIHQGGSKNLRVQNCEIAWIGGGIQGENLFGRAWGVRYGNGVEVGGCDGYVVTNCYIHQIYDAGVTHQADVVSRFDGKQREIYQKGIRYVDNVIERCNYSVEYFLSRSPAENPSRMEDFLIAGNLMWDAGKGLCEQRPDRSQDAHVKSWSSSNRALGYVIRDNVFVGAHRQLLHICARLTNADGSSSMPRLENNVFAARAGVLLGAVEQLPDDKAAETYVPLDGASEAYLNRLGSGNKVVVQSRLPAYTRVSAAVEGRAVPVEFLRCSKMPFNRRWPGRQRPKDQTEICGFVRFDWTKPAAVELHVHEPFSRAVVRPLSKGVKPVVEGERVRFTVAQPGQYSVEIDGWHRNLLVFADPPETRAVDRNDPKTRWFGPGEHDVGLIEMGAGETLYLAAGAVVYGRVHARDADGIRILGRGILDASRVAETIIRNDPAKDAEERAKGFAVANVKRYDAIRLEYCDRVTIDGIVIRDSQIYNIRPICCRDVEIRNVKAVGSWRYNADGFDLHNCERVTIRDSFIRTYDDALCIKGLDCWMKESDMLHDGYNHDCFRDVLVSNVVTWCDWGFNFEIGAETRAREIANVRFVDCDAIRLSSGACDVQSVDWADIHDIAFENIRVEIDDEWMAPMLQQTDAQKYVEKSGGRYWNRLLSSVVYQHPEYSAGGTRRGNNHGILFKDIRVTAPEMPRCVFGGSSPESRTYDVRIDGLYLNGRPVAEKDVRIIRNDFAAPVAFTAR